MTYYYGTDELRCPSFGWDGINSFHNSSKVVGGDLCWKVLTTQGCFYYCWAVLPWSTSLLLIPPHQRGGAHKKQGHSQDSCSQLIKGTFHTIWHHAQYIKIEGRGWVGNKIRVMTFIFLSKIYAYWTLVSGEWIPCFGLLTCMILPYLFNYLSANPQVSSLLGFSSHPIAAWWVGEGVSSTLVLGCWLGLNHTMRITHNCPWKNEPEKRSAHTASIAAAISRKWTHIDQWVE